MDRERCDEWLERGILVLVLAALVFAALALGAAQTPAPPATPAQELVGTLTFLIVEALLLTAGVIWLVRCWVKPKVKLLWPPICWSVVAFVAYAGFRYWTADVEYVTRQEVTRVFVYALLFFVILNNLHKRGSAQIFTLALLVTGMCIAGYAVYQFLSGSDHVWWFVTPYKHRPPGTFINPNNMAGFLEMLLPLGLAFSLTGRLPPLGKVFVGYASLVIAVGIAVSLSRGGWVASGLSVLVFLFVLLRYPNYRIVSIVLLVFILVAGGIALKKSTAALKRAERATSDLYTEGNRSEIWTSAARMWRDYPWLGMGPGHFNYRFREYRTELVGREAVWVHNDYLNTLVDWGVVGFLIVLSAWILLGMGVAKTWAFVRGGVNTLGDRKGNKFAFVLGASCGLLAILAHSMVDFNMHIPANAMLAIALMALLSAHLRSATERYWVTGKIPLKVLATLALAGIITGLGYWGWRRTHEYVWLARANSLVKSEGQFSNEQVKFLKKAFAVEPKNFETAYQIGWAYKVRSDRGNLNTYADQAHEAITWFKRVIELDPYYGYAEARLALCLDSLYEFDQAEPHARRASELDPNGCTTCTLVGLHYLSRADFYQKGYAVALPWFVRARHLYLSPQGNRPAYLNIPICERRLVEAARPLSLR